MKKVLSAVAVLLVCVLCACSSTVERVSDPKELQALGFLQANAVSRREVEGRLGQPGTIYENGRIVTYSLAKRDDRFEVTGSAAPEYTLVVVYRADDTLEKWSLVKAQSFK
ncbi:MAG TPA: hypothetical protein VEG36_01275 [Burkholderiales bacterium]|nr:hypothetical protein [Burkholderiales bacterium]